MSRQSPSPNADFICKHCKAFVSANVFVAGVQNRNHCPYCLWSRHLDLFRPGDRLAACKAPMQPVGLTLKRTAKRYNSGQVGELMLVHRCDECGCVSLNRIAADDDAEAVLALIGFPLEAVLATFLSRQGIYLLGKTDAPQVHAQLFGLQELRPC